MNRKYELLTDDTLTAPDGSALYRIRALRDFGDVKAGDLGGYVAGEHNLSHEGTCWVADNAIVYGNAQVYDDAKVYGFAHVYGDAEVYGFAYVYGNARVYGDAEVYGFAHVYGNAQVYNNVRAVNGDFGMKKPEQTTQKNNYNLAYSANDFESVARFVAKHNTIGDYSEEQVRASMNSSLKELKKRINDGGYENAKFTSTLGYYIIPRNVIEDKVFVEFAIAAYLIDNDSVVIL